MPKKTKNKAKKKAGEKGYQKGDVVSFTYDIKSAKMSGRTLKNKSQKGLILPPYRFEELIELVNLNVYANACTKQLVESIVGKGYADGVSDKVKEVFPIPEMERLVLDFIKTGNGCLEIDQEDDANVQASYHRPIQTLRKFLNKEDTKRVDWVQNYNDKKHRVELPEWNEYNIETLGLKENMILHFMNYDSNAEYGLPVWIAGRRKIQTLIAGDNYVYCFFDNDGMPKQIIALIGTAMSKDIEAEIKDLFESNYANGNGSKGHKGLFVQIPIEYGKIEKIDLNKNIVDEEFIKREREDKFDTCNAFRVPPILVGLQYQGKLGSSSELENIMQWYRDDVVYPVRRYIVSRQNAVLPDETIAYKELEIKEMAKSIKSTAREIVSALRAENELQDEE